MRIYLVKEEPYRTAIKQTLERATAIWNLMVMQLGDLPKAYFIEPESEESDKAFFAQVDAVANALFFGDPDGLLVTIEHTLDARTERMLANARLLPDVLKRERLSDLKANYLKAKRLMRDDPKTRSNYGVPGIKAKTSTKACRFPASHFSIMGDTLFLNTSDGCVTKVSSPEFVEVGHKGPVTVTVSNRSAPMEYREARGFDRQVELYAFNFVF